MAGLRWRLERSIQEMQYRIVKHWMQSQTLMAQMRKLLIQIPSEKMQMAEHFHFETPTHSRWTGKR